MRIVRISSIEQVSEQIPWALSVVRLIRVGRTWLTRIQWVESGTGYTLMEDKGIRMKRGGSMTSDDSLFEEAKSDKDTRKASKSNCGY